MTDPYLDFTNDNDLSNIQVNVFHVKSTLRGPPLITREEKEKILHNEVFIFNPKDSKTPTVNNKTIGKYNVIKDKIHLTDTIELLLNKIALKCCEGEGMTGLNIFAWIDLSPSPNPSLKYSYPLGIKYSKDITSLTRDGKGMNPYMETKYDNEFVNTDGTIKRDPKYFLDFNASYGSYYSIMKDTELVKPNYDIYFCTTKDVLDYSEKQRSLKDIEENHLFYGLFKKYFPKIYMINNY